MTMKKRRASRPGTGSTVEGASSDSFDYVPNDGLAPEASSEISSDGEIYLNQKNVDFIEAAAPSQTNKQRGATMANKQDNGAFENPFITANSSEAWRDYVNWQVKAAQSWVDQTLRFNQTFGDYVHNQMNENLRLTQEAMKYSVTVADDLKKGIFSLSERVTKSA